MRTLIMMLPMMFLTVGISGCGTTTRALVCREVKDNEIAPKRQCDLSFQFNRCRCRCFILSKWQSLPLKACKEYEDLDVSANSKVYDFPIQYCEGLSGHFIDDMAGEIRPKVKALNSLKEMYCD